MNIVSNLERSVTFCPDKPAIIFEDTPITYKELHLKVCRLASRMRSLGVKKGDRIALFMANIPEFAIVYYAAMKLGAIAVSLNVMLVKNEVKYILGDCGAKIIFVGEDQACQVPTDDPDALEHIILVEGDENNEHHISRVYDTGVETFQALDMADTDPAVILYTSGTTGYPKGATLSHFNVVANVNSTNYHIRSTKEDVFHLFLPLFHCFGQNFIMNSCIKKGATLVMHKRFEPAPVIKAVKKHKVTMFFAVPTIYIYLLNMKDEEIDFSSIRYFFTAASVMPNDVANRWRAKYGIPINDGYGLTECSPFACYNHDFNYKPGAIGHPVINVQMKIVGEDGKAAAPGEWGEICIKGPNVMLGYWNKPTETEKTIIDGWLHTGDVGAQDEDGDFFIVDRVKDMIISAGNNIYPAEVENHIYAHPAVNEVAVLGIPNDVKGESVKAVIVLKPGEKVDPEEMIEFCKERMSRYKVPKYIDFVTELPKSATGKILKRILRDEAAD